MSTDSPLINVSQPKPKAGPAQFRPLRRVYLREAAVKTLLAICSALSILTTLGIIYVLAHEGALFFAPKAFPFGALSRELNGIR